MDTESENISMLEYQVSALREAMDNEQDRTRHLEKQLLKVSLRLNGAESWGRGVLYATIAIAGVFTQLSTITTWMNKLLA